jgi:glycosyltransferase involved in cell wall biosynthesis
LEWPGCWGWLEILGFKCGGGMKVLLVSDRYEPYIVGGAEKVVQSLAEGLTVRGNEVVVATLSPNRRFSVGSVNGVIVYYLPAKNLHFSSQQDRRPRILKAIWHALDTYNPFMAASLGRILDAERPDIVNTHNLSGFSPSVWYAIKSRKLPLVHTAHDSYLLCPRTTMHRNGKNCVEPCADCQLYSRPRRYLSRFVDVATAVSRFTLNRHLRYGYFPTADSMAVFNSCRPCAQAADPTKPGNRAFRFGFLGRLYPAKGINLLIKSFLKVRKGPAELLIAGRGAPNYEQELKELTAGYPGIRWLGFVAPEQFLPQVDVLVVPSLLHDSAPLVVMESMACRVPLICSRRGGIPELIGDGTGWTFDPDDPDALTHSLRCAIDSRSELAAMGERGRDRASRFSTEAMLDGYLRAYAQAINKTARVC